MKVRADVLLVERGLAPTRSRAQALILGGRVYSGEQRIDKPGALLSTEAHLRVREGDPFVSRGGLKLRGALDDLRVDVSDVAAVDIGASTGGFTDCLLQRGARRVYAVDVGHGQLAQKLRDDPRVVVRERTNARHLTRHSFPEPIDLVVVDASFIGIGKLMPAIAAILGEGARLLALVKPQFEVGRDQARRHRGVIRDASTRAAGIGSARSDITAHGFEVTGECDSSLRGPKGNLEHFILATRSRARDVGDTA